MTVRKARRRAEYLRDNSGAQQCAARGARAEPHTKRRAQPRITGAARGYYSANNICAISLHSIRQYISSTSHENTPRRAQTSSQPILSYIITNNNNIHARGTQQYAAQRRRALTTGIRFAVCRAIEVTVTAHICY